MARTRTMYAPQLTALRQRRAELEAKLQDALRAVEDTKGEIRGIDHALTLFSGEAATTSPTVLPDRQDIRRARGAIKTVVLTIMDEHAVDGMKTADVVEEGKRKGIELDRNSVASLLSRLTKDEVLSYDRETGRYRPAQKPAPALRTVA